jgi:IS30 family transposase
MRHRQLAGKPNGGLQNNRATVAEAEAWERARRPKPCKLATNIQLNTVVADRLSKDWSPEQISRWLAKTYEANIEMRVSHETIYRSLFTQARDVLKWELISHLRSRRMMRRGKTTKTEGQPRGQFIDAVSIREWPAHVENRAVPEHWEGDLLSGAKTPISRPWWSGILAL